MGNPAHYDGGSNPFGGARRGNRRRLARLSQSNRLLNFKVQQGAFPAPLDRAAPMQYARVFAGTNRQANHHKR
jgi:hypothetical protein